MVRTVRTRVAGGMRHVFTRGHERKLICQEDVAVAILRLAARAKRNKARRNLMPQVESKCQM